MRPLFRTTEDPNWNHVALEDTILDEVAPIVEIQNAIPHQGWICTSVRVPRSSIVAVQIALSVADDGPERDALRVGRG